jgi:hypothetical protein
MSNEAAGRESACYQVSGLSIVHRGYEPVLFTTITYVSLCLVLAVRRVIGRPADRWRARTPLPIRPRHPITPGLI